MRGDKTKSMSHFDRWVEITGDGGWKFQDWNNINHPKSLKKYNKRWRQRKEKDKCILSET